MKIYKTVRIIAFVIVVLVIAALLLVHLFAGRAVKMGVEHAGTKALGVAVSVNDVDVSLLRGEVALQNLIINNPPGYQHPQLLKLKSARINVELGTLLKDEVNIKDIELEGIDLVIESKGLSGNNLNKVMDNIKAKGKEGEPSGKKLHIDTLVVSDIKVRVKPLGLPGTADTITLKLKPIRMANLGSEDKLDMVMLTTKVFVALVGGVIEQGTKDLPKAIVGQLEFGLKGLVDVSGELLKGGTKVLKDGKELGEGILKGIKKVIEPGKKEENNK
ncbi:MAG TPA: AsmA family protein [Planctomycetes bacterium]|nr:AsmA family protein [Planctomycetota bacterium]